MREVTGQGWRGYPGTLIGEDGSRSPRPLPPRQAGSRRLPGRVGSSIRRPRSSRCEGPGFPDRSRWRRSWAGDLPSVPPIETTTSVESMVRGAVGGGCSRGDSAGERDRRQASREARSMEGPGTHDSGGYAAAGGRVNTPRGDDRSYGKDRSDRNDGNWGTGGVVSALHGTWRSPQPLERASRL